MNLVGSIPLELTLLTRLQLLDLSYSPSLVGTVPMQLFEHVQALYLQETALTGLWQDSSPPSTTSSTLATLSALTDLRISAHQGPLTSDLAGMIALLRHLKWLEWEPATSLPSTGGVAVNSTSSTFPQSTESIPTEIGHLTHLQGLSLDGNRYFGAVPSELVHLTSLVSLDLCT
jgi:Leucine-rich repeat (LRR) protein